MSIHIDSLAPGVPRSFSADPQMYLCHGSRTTAYGCTACTCCPVRAQEVTPSRVLCATMLRGLCRCTLSVAQPAPAALCDIHRAVRYGCRTYQQHGGDLSQLRQSTELAFAPSNRSSYGVQEEVVLELLVKNTGVQVRTSGSQCDYFVFFHTCCMRCFCTEATRYCMVTGQEELWHKGGMSSRVYGCSSILHA